MGKLITVTLGSLLAIALAGCGNGSIPSAIAEEAIEVGCGSCIYGMDGVEGCVTAVKVGDKHYLVTGVELDAHSSGLCDSAKQAKVAGEVRDGKFVASKIELVSNE